MKTTKYLIGLLAITAVIGLTNCSKDDDTTSKAVPTPTENPMVDKIMIGEGDIASADLTVKLYADEAPFVGYNRIYTLLYKKGSNELVKNANVRYVPTMDMGMMTHRCPIESPVDVQPQDGVFEGAVVFIMESAGMGDWQFIVEVDNLDNEQSGQIAMDIEVVAKAEAKVFSFISEQDGAPVFVSLVEPTNPFVGINDFEITIHTRENHNSFPALDGVMVSMEPEMPTMGHGSPDNEDPVHTANGHYKGKVNFTMPGYWKVNLNFKDSNGNTIKKDQYFDLTF